MRKSSVSNKYRSVVKTYPNVILAGMLSTSATNARPPPFDTLELMLDKTSKTMIMARDVTTKLPRIGLRRVAGFQPIAPALQKYQTGLMNDGF